MLRVTSLITGAAFSVVFFDPESDQALSSFVVGGPHLYVVGGAGGQAS